MFKTLFSRMLAMYLTVILVLLLLVGVTVANMFKNQYMQEQEAELRREAEEINTILVVKYVFEDKRVSAMDDLRAIARKYDALIQVFDMSGGKLSFVYPESEEKWALADEVDISGLARDVMQGTKTDSMASDIYRGVTNTAIMSFMRPVVNARGEREGAIFFHLDMSAVNASIRQVYLDILLSACVAVMLAIIAVSYITGHITKPVIQMNSIVKRYTSGNFGLRLKQTSQDELGELAGSFNAMADELDTLEQSRKSFVANVSHELRSPLTSMGGFLAAMRDGTVPREEFDKYLDIVIDEQRRMTDMVNDLLDLARIESGQVSTKMENFDVNELIRRTLITYETRINEKKLSVNIDFGQEACYVRADSGQIQQVLRNLIDNAIKFSSRGGKLGIATRTGRQAVTVRVEDNGCGISPQDKKHIFDRFYKAEKAHTPKGGAGTGLGLAIVARILQQHEQAVRVDSKLGSGTAFSFTLRKGEPPGAKRKAQPGGPAVKSGAPGVPRKPSKAGGDGRPMPQRK